MSAQHAHPTTEELSAYSLGHLPEEKAAVIDDHISVCEPCCKTIVGLSSDDTFVGLLQEARQLSPGQTFVQPESLSAVHSCSQDVPKSLASHARYEVLGLIGKGGMGDVYQARHRMMNRTVALKIIKRELVRKPEAIDRFHREVTTAARLSHPNIVTSHDAEQAGEDHFMVMEYVDGENLAQKVTDQGPLPIADACDYIRQAAIGLQHAHELSMVHRDIKPHNLMVTPDGIVKILDFGLASLAPETLPDADTIELRSDLTAAGAIMGTPDFISPEQANDARKADIRSDIYSLGATLYFLLSGQPLFADGSVMSKLKSHATLEPTALTTLRDDIPAELAAVVSKMTAKQPHDRYQTPQEVADALRKLTITSPAPAKAHSPAKKWSIRAIGGSVILLTALMAFFPFNSAPVPDEVHAPLAELDSYIVAMMNSPHDLVFMNLGEIGEDQNYLVFEPIDNGIQVKLPAYPTNMFDKRQSGYADKFRKVASSLSLSTEDKGEFRNGQINGVNIIARATGEAQAVADKVRKVIEQTFSVTASEECEYTFQNLPSESSGSVERLRRVSADEFVREHRRGERVYFGEIAHQIYLIPHARQAEKTLQRNSDVWYTNTNELPTGFAARIRQQDTTKSTEGTANSAKAAPATKSELKLNSKTVTGGTGGIPKVHTWHFSGRDVGDWKVRLWLAQNGKADVFQEVDFEELPPEFTNQVRLEVRDPVGADHMRRLRTILYVECPADSRCTTTNEDKALEMTIQAPFSGGREPADLRQVTADHPELLFARGYWKGDFTHGTSMESMTEATKDGTATFIFVTLEWKAAGDPALAQKDPQPPVPVSGKMSADNIVRRLTQVHGNLVPKLSSMVSEAAGVPNGQWDKFARDPSGSAGAIKGEPLSLVLWKLNPVEAAKSDLSRLSEFQYVGGVPKPSDLSQAMSGSRALGYHSMIQPKYVNGLTYSVKAGPLNTARLIGNFRFRSPLYSGKAHFIIDVNEDTDLEVSEFSLPGYGVILVKDTDGWSKVGSESGANATKNGRTSEQIVEIFLLEREPIQGVTRAEGLQLSESGTGPLTYVRKEPLFVLSKHLVAECTLRKERADVYGKTFRWAVEVELTDAAETELLRRFRALTPKNTKWWLVSVNGKLGSAERTFHQSWKEFPKIPLGVFADRTEAENLQGFYFREE